MAIGLSADTTPYALARHLGEFPMLTVVANRMQVADAMGETAPSLTVVRRPACAPPSDALVGSRAVAVLQTVRLDLRS